MSVRLIPVAWGYRYVMLCSVEITLVADPDGWTAYAVALHDRYSGEGRTPWEAIAWAVDSLWRSIAWREHRSSVRPDALGRPSRQLAFPKIEIAPLASRKRRVGRPGRDISDPLL